MRYNDRFYMLYLVMRCRHHTVRSQMPPRRHQSTVALHYQTSSRPQQVLFGPKCRSTTHRQRGCENSTRADDLDYTPGRMLKKLASNSSSRRRRRRRRKNDDRKRARSTNVATLLESFLFQMAHAQHQRRTATKREWRNDFTILSCAITVIKTAVFSASQQSRAVESWFHAAQPFMAAELYPPMNIARKRR